jgi:3-deoxy-7-phosphoheptulonate synthase
MIIQLEAGISPQQLERLQQQLNDIQYKPTRVKTQYADYLIAVGKKEFDIRAIGALPGVRDVHRVSDDYKLVSRKWRVEDTVIDLGEGVHIGTGHLALMAGPCSIESEAQVEKVVSHLVEQGVRIMRGGVYKPRSSPILSVGWASMA